MTRGPFQKHLNELLNLRTLKFSCLNKQSGTKTNLVAKILATNFSVFFVINVMFSKICSMCMMWV